MGTDSTANFDLETVEKPSSTFRLAQTVPTSTVTDRLAWAEERNCNRDNPIHWSDWIVIRHNCNCDTTMNQIGYTETKLQQEHNFGPARLY